MKKIVIAICLSALAVSAMAQSLSPDAERARQVAMKCLYKYSIQLDDGVSNVDSIAKVVANSCRQESIQFVDLWTNGVLLDKNAILEKFFSTNIESASFFILNNRATKK